MPNENVTAIQSPEAHTTGVAVAYKESDPLAGLRAVALSGPFLGAIGSTIITVPVTTVGAIGFGITGIWTAINEFRSATRSSCAPHPMDISDTPRNHGLLGLLRELVQCPGLAPIVQGSCFLYSAVMACAQGQEFVGGIFVVFAMGECAAARIGNLGYKRLPRQPLGIEELLANQWQLMPERVKVILMDPGVYFCTGNLALILAQSLDSFSIHVWVELLDRWSYSRFASSYKWKRNQTKWSCLDLGRTWRSCARDTLGSIWQRLYRVRNYCLGDVKYTLRAKNGN